MSTRRSPTRVAIVRASLRNRGGNASMVNPERALALTEAVKLHAGSFGDRQFEEGRDAVFATALRAYAFLTGPATASVAFGPIVKQNTLEPTGKAGTAMAQIHDDEEFDLVLTAADAKGAEVLD